MLKVCMITPKAYPVPAVKGGAVEGLVDRFARENEREGRIDLTIISRIDGDAQRIAAKEFRNSKFYYVKYGGILDRIFSSDLMRFLNRLFARYIGRPLFEDPYMKRVCRVLRQGDYDLVVAEDWEFAMYGIVSRLVGNKKMCWHLHGTCDTLNYVSKWFSHYICVSNFIARTLVMDGRVSPGRVDVLRNGIQAERFAVRDPSYSRAAERGRHGIGESDMVFAYWGRLVPQKGVRELLRAFGRVRRRVAGARLLVVGSAAFGIETADPYEAELRRAAAPLGDGVVFTGFVKNDEMWRVLHMADVAVLPSICNDAASLANLEAGAAGLPLITTNVGGIPEYVDAGCAVILDWTPRFVDDLAAAMERLAGDGALRASMGERGLENARRHDASRYYEDYVGLLERYAAGGGGNGR